MNLADSDEKEFMKILSREDLDKLKKVSTVRGILTLVMIWISIFFLIYAAIVVNNVFFSLLCIVLIASRQLALALFQHEAIHGLVSGNKFLNDTVSELFCCLPLNLSLSTRRTGHLTHHGYAGVVGVDPEYKFYRKFGSWWYGLTKKKFCIDIIKSLSPVHNFMTLMLLAKNAEGAKIQKESYSYPKVNFFIYWTALLIFLFLTHGFLYFLIYWLFPFFCVLPLLVKLHVHSEHNGVYDPSPFKSVWSHNTNFLTRTFIWPLNSGYHFEHHFFPYVPWYNKKKLIKKLSSSALYSKRLQSNGYFLGKDSLLNKMLKSSLKWE